MLKTKKEIFDFQQRNKTYYSTPIMPWMIAYSNTFYPNTYSDFHAKYLQNMIYYPDDDSYYKIINNDIEDLNDTYIVYFKTLSKGRHKLIKYVSNEIDMDQLSTIHFKLSKIDITTCIATQSKQFTIDSLIFINTINSNDWNIIDYEFRNNQQVSIITSYLSNSIWNVNHFLEEVVLINENNEIHSYEKYENNVSPIPIEQRTIGNKAPSINEILLAY